MAGVQVINSLKPEEGYGQQWRLILQWCRYFYDDGSIEHGYRFIRVTPEGRLQPARGQNNLLFDVGNWHRMDLSAALNHVSSLG